MSLAYAVQTAGTTNRCSKRGTAGVPNDTYIHRRIFMKGDLTTSGITLAQVDYVELPMVVTSIVGSGDDHSLYSSTSSESNWGATLQATQADYVSTVAAGHLLQTQSVTSTGVITWTCDKTLMDFAGMNYFAIKSITAQLGDNDGAIYGSQNNATPSNRPVLRIVLLNTQIITIPLMGIGAIGAAGSTTDYVMDAGDGDIQQTETIPAGTQPTDG